MHLRWERKREVQKRGGKTFEIRLGESKKRENERKKRGKRGAR